jgi:hypothetical protein
MTPEEMITILKTMPQKATMYLCSHDETALYRVDGVDTEYVVTEPHIYISTALDNGRYITNTEQVDEPFKMMDGIPNCVVIFAKRNPAIE